MWGYDETKWRGDTLWAKDRLIMRVESDGDMWVVIRNDGTRSDLMNRTWAKHTARTWALSILNNREKRSQAGAGA